MSAEHLSRLERRRLATLCAFALDMEVLFTDAAVAMVEKMVGSLFLRAERSRSERLMDDTRLLKETARLHARLGRALLDVRWAEGDVLSLVASAIILWNTVYLGRAVDHLRHQGAEVPERLLAHVPPLGWEHVSLTGDYL